MRQRLSRHFRQDEKEPKRESESVGMREREEERKRLMVYVYKVSSNRREGLSEHFRKENILKGDKKQ